MRKIGKRQNRAVREAKRDVRSALRRLSALHPDWRDYETRMNVLVIDLPPSPSMSLDAYLEAMYSLAKQGFGA